MLALKLLPYFQKNKKWAIPLSLSLLGTLLLWSGIQKYKNELGYNLPSAEILVASKELPEGYVLTESDFAIQPIPRKMVPLGTLSSADSNRIAGLSVLRPVARGTLITWADLDVSYTPSVPSKRIATGYRGISISVSEVSSAAHSIRRGDRVDLVTTLASQQGTQEKTTMTLLQNITVLGVGNPMKYEDGEEYSTVTLMVLPREVALITLSQEQGKLTLALRNPDDSKAPKDLPVVGTSQLLESAFLNSIQDERNHSVEVIRGGQVSFDQ